MEGELMSSNLRPLLETDLDQILTWRNDPEVRRFMFQPDEIAREDHYKWFDHSKSDPSRKLFLFESNGDPQGFVNYSVGRSGKIAEWGFYTAPEAPRGTGRLMCAVALTYAFSELNMHKVCGQVISGNIRSIRLHEYLGFHLEGVLREQYAQEESYIDVMCFGILKKEWSERTRLV